MFSTDSYTSEDTYARDLIITVGRFSLTSTIVSLKDEGCDQKLLRFVFRTAETVVGKGGDCAATHRLLQFGVVRDHEINYDNRTYTTTRWRPTASAYKWSS